MFPLMKKLFLMMVYFTKVINVFNNGEKNIIKLKASNCHEIKTTSNHKFYVREKDIYSPIY